MEPRLLILLNEADAFSNVGVPVVIAVCITFHSINHFPQIQASANDLL
jgi:hypothetical protein